MAQGVNQAKSVGHAGGAVGQGRLPCNRGEANKVGFSVYVTVLIKPYSGYKLCV